MSASSREPAEDKGRDPETDASRAHSADWEVVDSSSALDDEDWAEARASVV